MPKTEKKSSSSDRGRTFVDRILNQQGNTIEHLNKNFKSIAQSTLRGLDVVSREEFDAQAAVLQRTRQRLERLEELVAKLEGKPDSL